jgi:branched-chain amino acid transport system substrate-binding protein
MKKIIALLLIALMGLSCTKQEETIKIGAILSETGSGAPYGKDNRRGIELAQEVINRNGGLEGKKIQVIFEDDQTQPKISSDAMNKLITQDQVKVVIGSTVSSCTLADAPIAEREKIILISPGASSPKITSAGDYVFRNWISDSLEGSKMAEYLFNIDKFKTIAIFYINNEYGVGLKNVVSNRFAALGGEVVKEDSYEQDASDFRTQLAKIKNTKPDALYLAGYYQEMAIVINQIKALAINLPIRSCVCFEDPELLRIAGKNAEGIIYSSPYFDLSDTSKVFIEFKKRFQEKFNREPGSFAAHGYDALMIIAETIRKKGYDGLNIRDGLYKVNNYPGVSGITTFDFNGDVIKPVAIKTVQNGSFVTLTIMP